MSIADNATLRPGTGDFTAGFWVKVPFGASAYWNGVLNKGLTTAAPANTWGFLSAIGETNRLTFYQATDAGGSLGGK